MIENCNQKTRSYAPAAMVRGNNVVLATNQCASRQPTLHFGFIRKFHVLPKKKKKRKMNRELNYRQHIYFFFVILFNSRLMTRKSRTLANSIHLFRPLFYINKECINNVMFKNVQKTKKKKNEKLFQIFVQVKSEKTSTNYFNLYFISSILLNHVSVLQ